MTQSHFSRRVFDPISAAKYLGSWVNDLSCCYQSPSEGFGVRQEPIYKIVCREQDAMILAHWMAFVYGYLTADTLSGLETWQEANKKSIRSLCSHTIAALPTVLARIDDETVQRPICLSRPWRVSVWGVTDTSNCRNVTLHDTPDASAMPLSTVVKRLTTDDVLEALASVHGRLEPEHPTCVCIARDFARGYGFVFGNGSSVCVSRPWRSSSWLRHDACTCAS